LSPGGRHYRRGTSRVGGRAKAEGHRPLPRRHHCRNGARERAIFLRGQLPPGGPRRMERRDAGCSWARRSRMAARACGAEP